MKNPAHKDFYKHYKKLSNRNMHIWLNLDELLATDSAPNRKNQAVKFKKNYPELS